MKLAAGRCEVQRPNCQGAASEVHHVIPVEEGGSDSITNARAVCRPCHTLIARVHG